MAGVVVIETPKRGIKVDTRFGIYGDRRFAVYRKPNDAPVEWKPKGVFHVCMNREGMAIDTGLVEADLNEDYSLDPEYVRGLLMGHGLPMDDCSLVDTKGEWHLADTNKPCVSFLNLASVRDLEKKSGVVIDPRRFRMSVWIDGLEPWVELDYITSFEQGDRHPMYVGGIEMYCDDLCERCKAIEQSPDTGKWDIELLSILEEYLKGRGYTGSPHRNVHKVMGWLAIPQNNGIIRAGQSFTFGSI